jgi:hypothetical protein
MGHEDCGAIAAAFAAMEKDAALPGPVDEVARRSRRRHGRQSDAPGKAVRENAVMVARGMSARAAPSCGTRPHGQAARHRTHGGLSGSRVEFLGG